MTVSWNTADVQARARRGARQGILSATNLVRDEVLRLILDTPKTGRLYRRRGVEHQASAPGEPPASDIGTLVNHIRIEPPGEDLVGYVISSAGHAPYLEFGTSRMAPRPHMRPGLYNKREEIKVTVSGAVRAALVG